MKKANGKETQQICEIVLKINRFSGIYFNQLIRQQITELESSKYLFNPARNLNHPTFQL